MTKVSIPAADYRRIPDARKALLHFQLEMSGRRIVPEPKKPKRKGRNRR
jgi:hypothetical protein